MHMSQASQNVDRIIRDEHESLGAVIHGMEYFTRAIAEGKKAPDLIVFRAMLLYVNDFPERVHHPKEDRYLFARLRQRTSQLDAVLSVLEDQHAHGACLIRDIELALARFEFHGAPAFPPFRKLVKEYAQFYTYHMHLEEETVFPAALRYLTDDDWIEMEAVFSNHHDPLAGVLLKNDFAKLFSLIVNIAPAPVGLAEAVS